LLNVITRTNLNSVAADNTYARQSSNLKERTLQVLLPQIRLSGNSFRTESEHRYDRPSP